MSLMIDKHDAKEEKKSLYFVKDTYYKTKLDGSFQRYGGFNTGSGWNLTNGLSYLQNLIYGATYNSIINIDVKEALRYAQELQCEDSIQYYESVLDEGFEYISVDGNNTTSFVTAFLESQDKIKVKIGNSKNGKLFKELSQEDQMSIQHIEKINTVTLRKILIHQACDLFRSVNQQTKLNNQEWRQARWSALSKFIRDIANNNNRKIFLNLVYNNESNLDTRAHEELIAQFSLKIKSQRSSSLASVSLDAFYEDNDQLPLNLEKKICAVLDQVLKISNAANEGVPIQRKLTKGTLHNLLDFVLMVVDEKSFRIKKHKELFEWFLDEDAKFQVEAGKVTEDDKEDLSYIHWTKFYYNPLFYNRTKAMFEASFLRDIEVLTSRGVVKVKRTAADNFTWEQKLELYIKQEALLRNGGQMSVLDLYLGKYEADHMIPVTAGGETTIENGELMPVIENRLKGPASSQKYFDFQK